MAGIPSQPVCQDGKRVYLASVCINMACKKDMGRFSNTSEVAKRAVPGKGYP
jgi:hypothetical protein